MNEKEVKNLRFSLITIIVGTILLFVACFLPSEDPYTEVKGILAVFGGGVAIGYSLYVFKNVYKPMKDRLDRGNR